MFQKYISSPLDLSLESYTECVRKIKESPLPTDKQEQMLEELHNVLSCLDNKIGPLLLKKQIQIIEKDILEFIIFT